MSKPNQDPYNVLRGGARLTIGGEPVLVREITPADILDGKYLELLRNDYAGLLDWLCGREPGWAKGLSREDWTALREAEEQVNFTFALAETKAAFERGQALKFIDQAMLEQGENVMRALGLFGLSQNTAGSPDAAAIKPLPRPSDGSGK